MQKYRDVDGDSGVDEYELGADRVAVKFKGNPRVYVYSNNSAGAENVENMKALAENGNGLNSFIMRNVRTKYEK